MSSTASASKNTDRMFKLDILKKKPRLSMQANVRRPAMVANEKYLLAFDENNLMVIDERGYVKSTMELNSGFNDIC